MPTIFSNYSQTDSPLYPLPIKQLDDLISPFLVPPQQLFVPPQQRINLAEDYNPSYVASNLKKSKAKSRLKAGIKTLAKCQDMLYAQNTHALLIIFQAMDAAGKDSTIKHVMSGINPQGCQVYSFKAPSVEELDHGYLWRCSKALPERGRIGIFNRSHYEEILITRVHPEIMEQRQLPPHLINKQIWERRFEEINNFEKYLVDNGTIILKFFLNVSKEEQKERFLERIDRPEKNWKFSVDDVKERARWDDYMAVYEDMFNHTSTRWAPWYIIPADHKWFTRLVVADIIYAKLQELDLKYPKVSKEKHQELLQAKAMLESNQSGKKKEITCRAVDRPNVHLDDIP